MKLLQAEDIDVTQATISRDIKEMQLIKVPNADEAITIAYRLKRN